MTILHAEGFDYRQTHVGIFQTPDGWHYDVPPVTGGEYPTRRAAIDAAKQFVIKCDHDRRDRGRFPTVAERGVW